MKKIALLLIVLLLWAREAQAGLSFYTLAQKEISLALSRVKAASLFEESWLETPWPVTVVTREDLKRYGWETLAQVLAFQPSFHLVQDLNHLTPALRGVYFAETSHLLFLEEGFRLNSPQMENFPPFWNYPLINVLRIEIVRGAGSSLYGDAALAGVVSLYRRPDAGREAGFWWGERGRGGAWFRIKKRNFFLDGAYYDSPPEALELSSSEDRALNPAPGHLPLREIKDNYYFGLGFKGKTWGFFGRYFRFGETGAASLFGENLRSEDLFAVSPERKTETLLLGGYYRFFWRSFQIKFRPFAARTLEESRFLTGMERDFPALFLSRGVLPLNVSVRLDSFRYGLEGLLNHRTPRSEWLLGAKGEGLAIRDLETINYLPPEIWRLFGGLLPFPGPILRVSPERHYESLFSLFCQWKYQLLPSLIWNLGMRYDHFEDFGGRISPRFSLIYRPQKNWALVFSYTRAYQSPAYVYRAMAEGYGNEKLDLQKSSQLALSWRYQREQKFFFSLTLYRQWHRDLVRLSPTDYLRPQNLGDWDDLGLEVEGRYEGRRFSGFFNYSYHFVTRNRTPEGRLPLLYGSRIAGIPRWMFKGGISYMVYPEVNLGLSFRLWGRSRFGNFRGVFWTPPVALWDLCLQTERSRWELTLKVENLFDKHFFQSGFLPPYPQPGRTWWLKWTLKF